jgi:hypothetical protein
MNTNHDVSSMPEKLKRQRRQMTLWESDDCKISLTSAPFSLVTPGRKREGSQVDTRIESNTVCSQKQNSGERAT